MRLHPWPGQGSEPLDALASAWDRWKNGSPAVNVSKDPLQQRG